MERAVPTVITCRIRFPLLAGDLNSVSPHDPVPADFGSLPPHHRARYLADDLRTDDRNVLGQLEAAGRGDLGHALGDHTPTVARAGFVGAGFATMRCDCERATPPLAAACTVVRDPSAEHASTTRCSSRSRDWNGRYR